MKIALPGVYSDFCWKLPSSIKTNSPRIEENHLNNGEMWFFDDQFFEIAVASNKSAHTKSGRFDQHKLEYVSGKYRKYPHKHTHKHLEMK